MKELSVLLKDIRKKKPLIHHITNQVTMNFLANGILAAGGSPMMALHYEEAEEAVMAADALVLNIGTVEPDSIKAMVLAGKKAKELGIPVILDPVGAGLSLLRKKAVEELVEQVSPDVICGNAAEISFLYGGDWGGKGVDGDQSENDDELALHAASKLGSVIVITGKKDAVSDGKECIAISGGHEILSYVTGTGCFSTSLIGLFMARSLETGLSCCQRAAGALTMLGICAERAKAVSAGPGSFQTALLDELYLLNPEDLNTAGRWS
ncbi:hydroxyethylthiazole kinase [Fictibacillus sp. KIGAM418]|uniref:Hydroxyethylthiazole kinase n=1 Tax=Fictibacillus marinisediminis TaxID=2878389 RepID=A0A9X1X9A5_9BACL|nr:hydroxyethylthiazole kinase [Fictibacillus marinisediminis]MCK6256582.1 hydroxyethylthiazole kinase [Fictibacillus marinisediminis]